VTGPLWMLGGGYGMSIDWVRFAGSIYVPLVDQGSPVNYGVGFQLSLGVNLERWAKNEPRHGGRAEDGYKLRAVIGRRWSWMVIASPAFAWGAASGMEVVPFAWLLARSVRVASEWAEARDTRTRRRAIELAALAWGATLMRPEGALAAIAIALTLARWPTRPT